MSIDPVAQMTRKAGLLAVALLSVNAIAANSPDFGVVWAVNVGGPAYSGADGTEFVAEEWVRGGTVGQMPNVKGSQDPDLYRTYRRGAVEIGYPIANGSYDVTFHFAEPDTVAGGERVFDGIRRGDDA